MTKKALRSLFLCPKLKAFQQVKKTVDKKPWITNILAFLLTPSDELNLKL